MIQNGKELFSAAPDSNLEAHRLPWLEWQVRMLQSPGQATLAGPHGDPAAHQRCSTAHAGRAHPLQHLSWAASPAEGVQDELARGWVTFYARVNTLKSTPQAGNMSQKGFSG